MNAWENLSISKERYESIFKIEQRTIVEVEVSDPIERQSILKGFQRHFDVEVVEHLAHECPPERFCLRFMATIAQSTDLVCVFLANCADRKSWMYQYSDGQVMYGSLDGKGLVDGDFFKLLRRIDDLDKNRADRKYIKHVLSAMDVYFPLGFDDENHRELSYLDLMKVNKNVKTR